MGPSAYSIFCCTGVTPVLADSSAKIHNDPNRDYHDALAKSFAQFAIRKHREAILHQIMNKIEKIEVDSEKVIHANRPLPQSLVPNTTPVKQDSAISPLTPPFTPLNEDVKGKGKEIVDRLDFPHHALSHSTHRKIISKEDEPSNNLLNQFPYSTSDSRADHSALAFTDSRNASKEGLAAFEIPYHPLFQDDPKSCPTTYQDLVELLNQHSSSVPGNRVRTSTLPTPILKPFQKHDVSRLRASSSTDITNLSTSGGPGSCKNQTYPTSAPTSHEQGGGLENHGPKGAKVSIHDHVMVIPTMPLPHEYCDELIENPLTASTEYVMHLTCRHDFGPVYSHRYFVCPINLEDDWTELTLLQWFACGEPFKLKAEKWDVKCEHDARFFRMTLRPNLSLRTVDGERV